MEQNVLLIVLDSVRPHNMGLYDYHRDTTPFLSTLAADPDTTVYEQARAPAIWSVPSHVSIFSGLHVLEHGVYNDEYEFSLDDVGIFSRLSAAGYDTGLFSGNAFLTGVESGLQDGFDTVWRSDRASNALFADGIDPDRFKGEHGERVYREFLSAAWSHPHTLKSLLNGAASKAEHELGLDLTSRRTEAGFAYADRLTAWIKERSGPWAACVNLMDAHSPFKPKREYDRWSDAEAWDAQLNLDTWGQVFREQNLWRLKMVEDLYDGAIRQCDQVISEMVETVPENTLIVITADHGEGFGEESTVSERRVVSHFMDIHETQTRVPLLVCDPDTNGEERRSEVVSIADIPRLIASRVGLEPIDTEFSSPVVTHSGELFSTKRERLYRNYQNTTEETGMAVYVELDDLYKSIDWNGDRFTYCLDSTGSVNKSELNRVTEELDRSASLVKGEVDRGIDGEVRDRLETLGYM